MNTFEKSWPMKEKRSKNIEKVWLQGNIAQKIQGTRA